jgi:tyrosyl-tRNA synthetase
MSLVRHLSSRPQLVCRQWVRRQHTLSRSQRHKGQWATQEADAGARQAEWEEQANRVRSGTQQSMLNMLEERGFVKDVAG